MSHSHHVTSQFASTRHQEVAALTRKITRRRDLRLDWTTAIMRTRLAKLLSSEEFDGQENTPLVLSANHVRNGW